jgi:hypothetical protein
MNRSRLDLVAQFGGIAFIVLTLGGFITADIPDLTDGTKIAAHVAAHRDQILIGNHVAAIGMLFFAIWAWWLMNAIENVEGKHDHLGLAVFIAGVASVAVELPVMALGMTLGLISDRAVDPEIAYALANGSQVFSYVDWFPFAIFFLTVAIAVKRTRIVGAWVAWTAFALVPMSLIAAAPTLGLDTPVALLAYAWVLAANIAFIRSKTLASKR